MARADRENSRPGLTLIELLVVVSILMLLLVVALPTLTPSVESRRLREAARGINVFFGAARTQAMQSGRPVGVMLERFPQMPQASMTLYQVEVPLPYSGDAVNSCAQLSTQSMNGSFARFSVTFSGGISTNLIRIGDQVQFNAQGPYYTLVSLSPMLVQLDVRDRKNFAWPPSGTWSSRVSYQFFRQPTRSAVAPLELPAGVVIDLQCSGTDNYANWFTPINSELNDAVPSPIMIVFLPNGSVGKVYFSNAGTAEGFRVLTEPIYLMVGKRQRVQNYGSGSRASNNPPDQDPNWYDVANLWVSIQPQTGVVGVHGAGLVPATTTLAVRPLNSRPPGGIEASRALARQAQTLGGR